MRFTDLPIGSCYLDPKKGDLRKKVGDKKLASVKDSGKVKTRKVKGDPEVEMTSCPLRYLGVGLRRHPDMVVEIGDGNITKSPRRRS